VTSRWRAGIPNADVDLLERGLSETSSGGWRNGLIIEGIEVKVKLLL
jgi:hypothetical protein